MNLLDILLLLPLAGFLLTLFHAAGASRKSIRMSALIISLVTFVAVRGTGDGYPGRRSRASSS